MLQFVIRALFEGLVTIYILPEPQARIREIAFMGGALGVGNR